MDDTGYISLFGKSCGSRNRPAFNWVRNITSSTATATEIEGNDLDCSASFALFWNMALSILPPQPLEDYKKFLAELGLPRMDAHGKMPYDRESGKGDYTIRVGKWDYTFRSEELAPPTGVISENYSRYAPSVASS